MLVYQRVHPKHVDFWQRIWWLVDFIGSSRFSREMNSTRVGVEAQHTLRKLGMVHGYKTNVELLGDLNFVSKAL